MSKKYLEPHADRIMVKKLREHAGKQAGLETAPISAVEYWRGCLASELEALTESGLNRGDIADILGIPPEDMNSIESILEKRARSLAEEFPLVFNSTSDEVELTDPEGEVVTGAVNTIYIDRPLLSTGEGRLGIGKGGEKDREKKRKTHKRKEALDILLTRLGVVSVRAKTKSKEDLSSGAKKQIESTVRDYDGLYDLFVIPDKGVSIFVSDLHGEGTHIVFVNPGTEEEDIENFLGQTPDKYTMRSFETYPHPHEIIPFSNMEDWLAEIERILNDVPAEVELVKNMERPGGGWYIIGDIDGDKNRSLAAVVGKSKYWINSSLLGVVDRLRDEGMRDEQIKRPGSYLGGRSLMLYSVEVVELLLEIKQKDDEWFTEMKLHNYVKLKYGQPYATLIEEVVGRVSNDEDLTFKSLSGFIPRCLHRKSEN